MIRSIFGKYAWTLQLCISIGHAKIIWFEMGFTLWHHCCDYSYDLWNWYLSWQRHHTSQVNVDSFIDSVWQNASIFQGYLKANLSQKIGHHLDWQVYLQKVLDFLQYDKPSVAKVWHSKFLKNYSKWFL